MKNIMNSKYSSYLMIGVGQLMYGIATIFFLVALGFFDNIMAKNLTAYTGLSQVVPVTPLILWVVVFLLGILASGVGVYRSTKQAASSGSVFDSYILIGVGILMFGISTIFFGVTLGFFDSLIAFSNLSTYTGLSQIIPVTPLIMWVVTMLMAVFEMGVGGMQVYKKTKAGNMGGAS